ncbi:MAG: cell division protein FtsQ/DivIB [Rhodospirillaceae bacterium]
MRRLMVRICGIFAAAGAIAAALKFTSLPDAFAQAAAAADEAFVEATAGLGFRLAALTVEGREMTAAEDLLGALDAEVGTPIAAIDVVKARAKVEALPWVKSAKIERRLPNTIHMVLTERVPYALWQRGGHYTLVDHEGELIADVPESDIRLPLIVGADAPANAAVLFEALKTQPELARRVQAAVRVGARRWNIYLDAYEDGISVRLPEENMNEAWTRLATLERDHKILERDLEFIDLRLADQLIVRPRKTPEQKAPATAGAPKVPVVPVKQSL